AVVKGVVSAGAVVNGGKMNATITARESIQISKAGILIGDIRTPLIGIEDGAHFHGMCDMGAHKWVEEQPSLNKPLNQAVGDRGRIRASGY
ncbi:MAG: polymer-forming cytoskeletal protein, partial [Nitrospira sp.]|nr:polymer-forming cytoskeletal protein [Nitrospira sp.]